MQIGRAPATPSPASDLARALHGVTQTAGSRPAVTLLLPGGRQEQGFVSLSQWAAKGAHYLQIEHFLEPGDRVSLIGPAGWMPAAVCAAAWWAGITVVIGAGAEVAIVHESMPVPEGAEEVVWFGDAFDGSPAGDIDGETDPLVYAVEVQAFPDQPPSSRAEGSLDALVIGEQTWTQRELIDAAGEWPADATLGLDAATALPELWVPAVCARPLVTGRPTVVVSGTERDAATGDHVTLWL